jgi:hypothetical protein
MVVECKAVPDLLQSLASGRWVLAWGGSERVGKSVHRKRVRKSVCACVRKHLEVNWWW